MKKYYFIIVIGIAALFNSCIYNFEEGADISFRSISQRVEGKWYIRGVWVNGIDSSGYFPYNQYTQKDSLTLEFIHNEQYGSEKISYLKSNINQQNRKESRWKVTNSKKSLWILNMEDGFENIFFEKKSTLTWKIIECRNKRLILDLSEYYSNSNNRQKATKQLRILLIAA
jgi:hypothetical protein